jgi:sodium/bile acid cotransporter 7
MINIIIVFLISGLTLNTKNFGPALKHWPGILWGFITILGITPCLGFALNAIPFTPSEFAAGLAIFSAAPTTLGVGAALVRQSKGNDALALILLIGTNLIAVFTLPLWLKALIGGDGGSYTLEFSLGQMFWQLIVTVFVPAVVGKALRELIPPVARFATKYKEPLSMFSVANLAFIVWQTLSAAQHLLIEQKFVNILYIIIAAIIQHAIYLVFNALMVAFVFKMPIEEGVAVVIMGSQKSAPVAVTAILYITDVVSTQGLLSVPCIIAQLVQIFMGAAYAPWVAKYVLKVKEKRAAAAAEAVAADQLEAQTSKEKEEEEVALAVDESVASKNVNGTSIEVKNSIIDK